MNIFNLFGASSFELNNGVCTVDGVIQSTTQPCDDALKGIFGILAAIIIPLILIGLALFIFWIIFLIHAIKKEDLKDREMWIMVLLGGFLLGFIWLVTPVYYFAAKRPYNKGVRSQKVPAPNQTQNTVQQPVPASPNDQPPTNNFTVK